MGPTRLTNHYHSFLQYIQLSVIRDNITSVQRQLQTYQTRLENDTFMLYELQIDYLNSKLNKVLDQLQTLEPNRKKRGLINGLGSVIKSLTGNLDYEDATRYNDALRVLQNNQDKVVSEFNRHISLCKEWLSKHNSILNQLVENQVKINATLELLLDRNAYRDSSLLKYAKFAQLLEIITENVNDITEELLRIENTLAFIRASSTHHSMIGINVLKSMLDKLKELYNNDEIINLELREYYDVIKPSYYYFNDQIVIVFQFPIVSIDTYDLYKLAVVPNKHHQALIPSYPYLATNDNSFVHIEAECPKFGNLYLCDTTINHQIRKESNCIQELITNHILKQSCNFTTVSLSRPAVQKLDDQHYVTSFPRPTRVQLNCRTEDSTSLEGSYLITIPINCHLHTTEFTISNENGKIEGQPLKLMKIPYNAEKQAATSPHLHLNSIDLEGLHSIRDQVMLEQPIHLDTIQSDVLYHTTIPFYFILLSASTLIM